MADVKLQLFQGTTNEADFRGEKELGEFTDPVDRHMTIAETRIPDEQADEAIALAKEFNKVADRVISTFEFQLAKFASMALDGSGEPRLAVRVYKND